MFVVGATQPSQFVNYGNTHPIILPRSGYWSTGWNYKEISEKAMNKDVGLLVMRADQSFSYQ